MSTDVLFGNSWSVYRLLKSAVGERASENSSCLPKSRVRWSRDAAVSEGLEKSGSSRKAVMSAGVGPGRSAVSVGSRSTVSLRRTRGTLSWRVMGTLAGPGDGVPGASCARVVGGTGGATMGVEVAASMAARRGLVSNVSTTTWLRDCRFATAGVAWEMGRKMPEEK